MSCKYCHESMPPKPKDEFCSEICREEYSKLNPTGKKIEKWEKEFDDEFKGENEFEDGDYIVEEQAIEIKRFISSILDSQMKEVLGVIERIPRKKVKTDGSRMWIDFGNTKIKDVEEMVENGENNGYNDALDDLKAEVEKLV